MALLALDIGNTRLKWALFDDANAGAALPSILSRGAMFLAEVDQLVEREGFAYSKPSRVIGSHVAGIASREKIERQFAVIGVGVRWMGATQQACGVTNGYVDPTRLGTDRWAALIAAKARNLAPCVVVSAGTALTVDQLDEQGNFLGGAIVAGYHAMLGGLAGNTAALSVDAGDWAAQPKNTRDALATGAIDAMVGAILRGRDRLSRSLRERGVSQTPRIVLTGGSAYRLLEHIEGEAVLVDALALEGVYWLGRNS
jgi:type III pantothenate kinase